MRGTMSFRRSLCRRVIWLRRFREVAGHLSSKVGQRHRKDCLQIGTIEKPVRRRPTELACAGWCRPLCRTSCGTCTHFRQRGSLASRRWQCTRRLPLVGRAGRRDRKDSPGWSFLSVNETDFCGVIRTRRRWYSAQVGKPNCRAGEAAEHRDNKNATFHHGAILLPDKRAEVTMAREQRRARELGCALRRDSSEAGHRHQGGRAKRCTDPIVVTSR
jgi:hypothetical protein